MQNDIVSRIHSIISKLPSNPTSLPQLMQELDQLLEDLKHKINQLDVLEKEFARLAEKYFTAQPPFYWNTSNKKTEVPPLNEDECFSKDLKQYETLVFYSVLSGDREFKLLKTWGIDYPLNTGYKLARPINDYLEAMEYLIKDQENSEEESECYSYIYQKLKANR